MTTEPSVDVHKSKLLHRRAFLVGLFAIGVVETTTPEGLAFENPFSRLKPSQNNLTETARGVFTFQTDFDLAEIEPELKSLDILSQELTQTLKIPAPRETIVARIFPNEESWRSFFKTNFPSIAYRSAMFDRKNYLFDSRKLRLYAYRGANLRVDLCHEGTHALLTSSLRRSVPIWLDEGLAEYFETPQETRVEKPEWFAIVKKRLDKGLFSSLEQLENVINISGATPPFYCDSWAWTNYLLNDSHQTRAIVSEYLNDLAKSRPFASKVSARLKKIGAGEKTLRQFYDGLPRSSVTGE